MQNPFHTVTKNFFFKKATHSVYNNISGAGKHLKREGVELSVLAEQSNASPVTFFLSSCVARLIEWPFVYQTKKFFFPQSDNDLAYSKDCITATQSLILHFLRKNTSPIKLIVSYLFQKEIQDWANNLNQQLTTSLSILIII